MPRPMFWEPHLGQRSGGSSSAGGAGSPGHIGVSVNDALLMPDVAASGAAAVHASVGLQRHRGCGRATLPTHVIRDTNLRGRWRLTHSSSLSDSLRDQESAKTICACPNHLAADDGGGGISAEQRRGRQQLGGGCQRPLTAPPD